MTQKDKELLLKDISARLPYGVKIQVYYEEMAGSGYFDETVWTVDNDEPFHVNDRWIENIKPYLLPMSSMTEEQKKDIFSNGTFFISNRNELGRFPKHSDDYDYVTIDDYLMIYKKLIENHFDVNGLIPKGLAIDATSLQIY